MCGIAGVISLGRPIEEKDAGEARIMTELLRHRGPDDIGFFQDDRCVLGNTRLRIIDLSDNAGMPMSNEDEKVWITYNGEVTNYKELSREFKLEERHRFRSTSDTEVLVHLYEELGIDFIRRLSGMFAFCLVDKRKGKAYIVRDFYGIRPLFFMQAGDRLYFSSEIKSFIDLDRFDGEIDQEAIYHFFSLAYIPDRLTPFAQVQELPGASLLEVDLEGGSLSEREYHEVRYDPDPGICEKEAVPALKEHMIDSVRRNLISDAPLGLTLSGGFDTSSMLAITKELGLSRDIHTFSIRIDEPSYDESRYQRIMVDYAKPQHHEIVVRPNDVADNFVAQMAFLDEPTGDGAAIPTFLLAEEARKHVSVLLSGEGGDEIFNAYETHVAYKARKAYRRFVPRPLRSVARRIAMRLPTDYRKLSFDFLAKRFSEGAELGTPESHFFWRHTMDGPEKRSLMPSIGPFKDTEQFFSDLFHSLDFEDELNRISLIDIKYFFIGDLMVKNDRMMMAHSVEARFPWMDRILFDYVSTIPSSLRMKGFSRRYLQKQAMKDLVPDAIYRRQNMGLEMPHSLWFMDALKPLAERYLTREKVERTGMLDYDAVNRMWGEHINRVKDHGRSIWCILNFMVWHDLFVYEKNFKAFL